MKNEIKNQQKITKSVEKMFFELYSDVIDLHNRMAKLELKMAKLEMKIILANQNNKRPHALGCTLVCDLHENTPESDISSDTSDDSYNYYNESESESESDSDSE